VDVGLDIRRDDPELVDQGVESLALDLGQAEPGLKEIGGPERRLRRRRRGGRIPGLSGRSE